MEAVIAILLSSAAADAARVGSPRGLPHAPAIEIDMGSSDFPVMPRSPRSALEQHEARAAAPPCEARSVCACVCGCCTGHFLGVVALKSGLRSARLPTGSCQEASSRLGLRIRACDGSILGEAENGRDNLATRNSCIFWLATRSRKLPPAIPARTALPTVAERFIKSCRRVALGAILMLPNIWQSSTHTGRVWRHFGRG